MIATRFYPLGGHKTPAMKYPQGGLILHLDGIENDGYGMHSSNPTTWKDLTNKHDLTSFGVPIYNENNVFLDGSAFAFGLEDSTNAHFEFNSQHIVDAINSGEFTIELIQRFSERQWSEGNCGHIAFGENVRGFWIWTSPGYGYSAFSIRKNGYTSAAILWEDALNRMLKIRVLGSKLYLNNELLAEDSSTGTVAGLLCMIGKLHNLGCVRGNFYAVRVYNRVLTEEETALTDSLDNERFGTEL